jgi:hypothetical protein
VERAASETGLARLAGARELVDEHERFARYVESIPLLTEDREMLALFCDLVAADADRVMAESAAGVALVPGTPAHVVDAIGLAFEDRVFVLRRIAELTTVERLAAPSYAGDPERNLKGAAGWLEETLAERSKSLRVLKYLAVRATRRPLMRRRTEGVL